MRMKFIIKSTRLTSFTSQKLQQALVLLDSELREAPPKKNLYICGHCPNCDLTPPIAQIRALTAILTMEMNILTVTKGSRKKTRIFYGQADRKGGGVSPPRPDRSICENFRT